MQALFKLSKNFFLIKKNYNSNYARSFSEKTIHPHLRPYKNRNKKFRNNIARSIICSKNQMKVKLWAKIKLMNFRKTKILWIKKSMQEKLIFPVREIWRHFRHRRDRIKGHWNLPVHHSTIVLRGLRGPLIGPPLFLETSV